jgi:hypothetical protein
MHPNPPEHLKPSASFVVPSLATPPVSASRESPPELPVGSGPVVWDWAVEHADRAREKQADAARAKHHGSRAGAGIDHDVFDVDRKIMKDLVAEKMGEEVGRIVFVGSGMSSLKKKKSTIVANSVYQALSTRYLILFVFF